MPVTAFAHEGAHDPPPSTSAWDLLAIGLVLAGGLLYALGRRRLRQRGATQRLIEPAAFWVGWSAMMAAVLPPLDHLAVERFSAHMLQHELLMLVGAPLMVAGRPMTVWLWGLPERQRLRMGQGFQRSARRACGCC